MSFFINSVEDERCVFLSYEGEVPPVELSAARYEANGVLDQRQWNRMVIDMTQLKSVPSPPQLIDYAQALSSDVPRGGRVALVARLEQARTARVVQKVAWRGGASVACFRDPQKAVVWVKQTTRKRP